MYEQSAGRSTIHTKRTQDKEIKETSNGGAGVPQHQAKKEPTNKAKEQSSEKKRPSSARPQSSLNLGQTEVKKRPQSALSQPQCLITKQNDQRDRVSRVNRAAWDIDRSAVPFRFGEKSSSTWAQIPALDSYVRLRLQAAEEKKHAQNNIFTYRKALGGFGKKPSQQLVENDDENDDESDAGSVFSEAEGNRRERIHRMSEYTKLLPGYEVDGIPREKSHLRRIITSADNLYPVRHSLKTLGVDTINNLVYDEKDASKLMSKLSADIFTGMWSCCRKTNSFARGCHIGDHSKTKLLCTRCGKIYDSSKTSPKEHACYYHPGAINRSKTGGVWWTCCGAVGFQNSLLHSSGVDGPDFKWGCKIEPEHSPIITFDLNTKTEKYVHCTYGPITKQDCLGPQLELAASQNFYEDTEWAGTGERVTCCRIASITCVAQPLLPIILGIHLQYESVADSEFIDGDRYVGNPGLVSDRDHLRKIQEEKLVFKDDEYMIGMEMVYDERNIQVLTVFTSTGRVHVFFERWKLDNNEKTLKEMQESTEKSYTMKMMCPSGQRAVGLRYGIGDSLRCLGLLTQRLVVYDPTTKDTSGEAARCTLCAQFYMPPERMVKPAEELAKALRKKSAARARTKLDGNEAEVENAAEADIIKHFIQDCVFHSGFWTPQRRVRLADNSTMRTCCAKCEANNCSKKCNRYEHRSHIMVHSCGDNRCSDICDMQGCGRRCATRDHFHGTNDPMALHNCGGAHPCKTPCVCGKPCKFVSARGEAVHTWHWCGGDAGCNKPCSVPSCDKQCSHPNHHHDLEDECFHHCGNEHPCFELCSAQSCKSKCMLDREKPHKHMCNNLHRLGCRVKCTIDDCQEFCGDPDHFHADFSICHKCTSSHPCRRLCSAPGCKVKHLGREKAIETQKSRLLRLKSSPHTSTCFRQ